MEDIEIARKAKLENITKIATKLGIDEEYIEQYGKYKAKISCKLYEKLEKKNITVENVKKYCSYYIIATIFFK